MQAHGLCPRSHLPTPNPTRSKNRCVSRAVYGLSLVNLNHQNLNAAAIDLGDIKNRVAVQVTSERTKAKIQKTLDSFSQHGLAVDYDTLKVLIIGDRTGDYPTLTLPEGVTFS